MPEGFELQETFGIVPPNRDEPVVNGVTGLQTQRFSEWVEAINAQLNFTPEEIDEAVAESITTAQGFINAVASQLGDQIGAIDQLLIDLSQSRAEIDRLKQRVEDLEQLVDGSN